MARIFIVPFHSIDLCWEVAAYLKLHFLVLLYLCVAMCLVFTIGISRGVMSIILAKRVK